MTSVASVTEPTTTGPAAYTDDEVLKELKREIAMRKNVYPDLIRVGRLTREEAHKRVAILLQICRKYGGHGDQR